jgi:hypothetical protein
MSDFFVSEQLDLPRVTGTLRAFSNVSKKFTNPDSVTERALIQKRRRQTQLISDNLTDSGVPLAAKLPGGDWPALCLKLIPSKTDPKYNKLRQMLDKLRTNSAKQLLNEDFNDNKLLNEAAWFIFELFYQHYDDSQTTASNFTGVDKLQKKLKEKFGQFQRNHFDNLKDLMESVFTELNNLHELVLLAEVFGSSKLELVRRQSSLANESLQKQQEQHLFGENIKFYSIYDRKLKKSVPSSDSDEEVYSSEDEVDYNEASSAEEDNLEGTDSSTFEFKFPTDSTRNDVKPAGTDSSRFLGWTKDLSSDLCTIVYEALTKKSLGDAEIQNELVELLGFEKLELVEFLCTHRSDIVNAYNNKAKGNLMFW